jgi:hypothetical protein
VNVLLTIVQHPPALHASPSQQCCPGPPHATQLPAWQYELGAVQTPPPPVDVGQQRWPTEPQVTPDPWHAPLVQTSGLPPHAWPFAVHLFPMQNPPLAHEAAAQHGWPLPPHAVHAPPTQRDPSLQFWPAFVHRPLDGSQHPPAHPAHAPPSVPPPSFETTPVSFETTPVSFETTPVSPVVVPPVSSVVVPPVSSAATPLSVVVVPPVSVGVVPPVSSPPVLPSPEEPSSGAPPS